MFFFLTDYESLVSFRVGMLRCAVLCCAAVLGALHGRGMVRGEVR
jgi:hypothetical protein